MMALDGAQLHTQAQLAPRTTTITEPQMALDVAPTQRIRRKRKAGAQDNNERLSKRLSLLNLEQNGPKLYVPVENPTAQATSSSSSSRSSRPRPAQDQNDIMQVDDSKYKVYIYNLDDELSSESEPEDGKLVFLPDIEKHLRTNRIPPAVMANSEGELAGMQLVLYNVPSSITVPEKQDSVRKAIIEARARIREKQNGRKNIQEASPPPPAPPKSARLPPVPETKHVANGFPSANSLPWEQQDDPDAMDMS